MEVLKLTGIKIKNYRSIKEFPECKECQDIGSFTTIIGKNDAGKSNILNAIRIVLEDDKLTKEDFHKGTNEDIEISLIFDASLDKSSENITKVLEIINPQDMGLERYMSQTSRRYTNSKIRISKIFKKDYVVRSNRGHKGTKTIEYFDEENREWIKIRDVEAILSSLPEVIYIPCDRDAIEETTQKSGFLMSRLLMPLLEKQSEEGEDNIQKLKAELQKGIKKNVKNIGRAYCQ